VVANVAPALCRALQQACRVKDWAQARSIQNSLDPLIAALAREPNPGPIKQALSLVRPEFSREPRLPLVGVAPGTASAIEHALRASIPACGRQARERPEPGAEAGSGRSVGIGSLPVRRGGQDPMKAFRIPRLAKGVRDLFGPEPTCHAGERIQVVALRLGRQE